MLDSPLILDYDITMIWYYLIQILMSVSSVLFILTNLMIHQTLDDYKIGRALSIDLQIWG